MRLRAERGFPVGLVLGAWGGLAGVAVVLLHLDRLPVTVCLFKRMTGLPCASCGSTRVLAHLLHLDVPGAVAMNPLAAVIALLALGWFLADLVLAPGRQALTLDASARERRLLQLGAVAAILANWIYLIAAGR